MDSVAIGKAGLKGWRASAADLVAAPVARRSPLSDDQVRAAVGSLFFALAVVYVVGTLRRILADG
jgi:hypothetical protein